MSIISAGRFDKVNHFTAKVLARLSCGWKETGGQDLIEYALMAGFVAVTAGAIMPNIMTSISTIFSQVLSILTAAGTQGS